ncbi:AMP-binding protein [Allokutzneria albata]|uniref:Long-chain acyl-CoA synthetase n=1 Tax=Allokutzneria albata TaxID=211114 RepID=A0A1G9VAI2_ALLAB|nr:AMP-binding protein [Allokutzneria albata]SDM69202.1 long-chain acyl-CoA synthetase [Allokutzneria albata]
MRERTLGAALRAQVSARTALICGDTALSYADLDREADRVARHLSTGERVAYLGKESPHYYELLFGCSRSGAVLVPINWRLTAAEVGHVVEDSGATVVFADQSCAKAVPDLPVVWLEDFEVWKAHAPQGNPVASGPDDAVVQLYTSGTTGLPKGVVLGQHGFFEVCAALRDNGLDWLDWRSEDISLVGVPGFHIGGLWWAVQGLVAGITNVIMPAFTPGEAVRLVREHGVTITCVVPAMLRLMLDERRPLTQLRKIVYGGSPISEALLARCLDEVGCELAQIYGLTETGNTAVCLPPSEHVPGGARMQAAGRPYPGFAVEIRDREGNPLPVGEVGEVWLRSPATMLEYWNNPAATEESLVDGWLRTGDAGHVDEEGYVFLRDRIKDMIIVAGENVYPAEIEGVLAGHPAVADAAVIGVPDERWGEAVHAFVVTEEKVTARELMVFLQGKLASFKLPLRYEFVEAIPRNPSGKVLRRVLRDRFWRDRERQVN